MINRIMIKKEMLIQLRQSQMGVDGYATSEIAGKILITKFPKLLEETKKEKEERGKKGKSGRKGGREEDPSKQEENACS